MCALCQEEEGAGSFRKIPRLSVRQADALGDSGIQREVTAQLDPFMQKRAPWGNTEMQGACQVSCILNQVQLLNNKVKGGKSGICPGKDGNTPGKLLWAPGYHPALHPVAVLSLCCSSRKLFWGLGKSLLKEMIFILLWSLIVWGFVVGIGISSGHLTLNPEPILSCRAQVSSD